MEEGTVVKLISQYLHEHGFTESLKSLQTESGRSFHADTDLEIKCLQDILDEYTLRRRHQLQSSTCVENCFGPGENQYADKLWCSFDGLSDGVNVLVVVLLDNGVMVFGGAKSQLGVARLPLPLSDGAPPITPVPTIHSIGSAGVLSVALHPQRRNVLLCGSMDRSAYIVSIDEESERAEVIQKFSDHTKYVVHALWAPSGKFFVTGSYDHSLCVYRSSEGGDSYELVEKLPVNGAVESLAFAKGTDEFIVGIRNSHLLHCYNVSTEKILLCRTINMNEFGDDFVSFVPLHITFSPDGQFFLVSTDKDRIILFSWETGKQIANFYGAISDELSQPRHCWDSSGKYIYGTSQDNSICVWEIRSQKLVGRLTGHSGTVRNLYFCKELGVLVSCGFDGTIKLWKRLP